jgi:prephenate dehydrogenase
MTKSLSQSSELSKVRIVGTGLIGTSIALALAQNGVKLELDDSNPENLRLAKDLISAQLVTTEDIGDFDLIIIATPPSVSFELLKREFANNPDSMFIDIGSVKTNLLLDVEGLSDLAINFVGTHPMAGRELSGAASAQADLFHGRAWVITPLPQSCETAVLRAKRLIGLLGATAYVMSASEHDQQLATISHLPQILSTALSASLVDSGAPGELAGQGLRDMTRIAASDGQLWSEIILENQKAILEALQSFELELQELKSAVKRNSVAEIKKFFAKGNDGRALISGKHGAKPRNYQHLLVVIKDEPGALSRLFSECAEVSANIEDLSIEHSPGQLTGLITLALSPEDADRVESHLLSKNWKVHRR